MDAKIATIHSRLGGVPVRNNVVCRYWMMGKCNRNPCRFMHRELPPPNVYRRTSEQPNLLRKEQSIRSPSHGLKNSLALSDGSEVKTAQNSTNHVIKDPPRKRPNPGNSLASNSGGGGGNASEEKTVECSKKACENWMSDKCDKEDGCQFLHSWFYGDWFSTLAKLKGHIQAVSGIALPSRSDKLFSSSIDGAVHVWDCNTGQSTRVINVGVKIGALISEGPWIFVGLPNIVKAWNIETAAEFNLDGPVGQVNAIAVADVVDKLFAGHRFLPHYYCLLFLNDGAILAWKGNAKNPNRFELASSMKGHTSAVICLTIGRNRLYSGSVDNTIRAWDVDTLQCVHTLSGHNDAVTSLICWDQYLLSCSLDKTIKAWAFTEEGNLDVIYTHNEEHGAIALCGMHDAEAKPILLCSCSDSTVYLYELPTENGFEGAKSEEHAKESVEEPGVENEKAESAALPPSEEVPETTGKEEPAADGHDAVNTQQASVEDLNTDDAEKKEESEKHSEEDEDPASDTQTTSRKMEVPNDKVGVLIGKGGDTIRYLQYNSGAKIQITRDADANPQSTTRPVEIIGTLSNIKKAEKLINAVIAEVAELILFPKGLPSAQTGGVGEQLEMQVPNEKVGLIIGRGGDAIKALQAKLGGLIQLCVGHCGRAELNLDYNVCNSFAVQHDCFCSSFCPILLTVRSSPYSGSFNQSSYRSCGPTGPSNWGPRGPHSSQPNPYYYHLRGPYPSQSSQYPPPSYGGYAPQQMGPRGNFGSGWEQRPPTMQGPVPHGGVYDYGVQGGHVSDHPASGPISTPVSGHAPSPVPTPAMSHPPSQANYNYGQPHGPDYGHQAPYSQAVPSQQGYGPGYDEPKYDNHAPMQHPYGHGSSQPVYPQASNQPRYRAQQQYGKQPSYGMPLQGPPPQSYGPPRPSQPGDMPYQGPIQSSQSYGPNVPPQQQYPYASSGQSYPSNGSASGAEGYNQAMPTSGPGYPQQGSQPVPCYGQPGGQQSTGYVQGPTGGYGLYPSSQQGCPEQPASNNAGYGYQRSQDPAYGSGPGATYGAPPSGQQAYAQPTATQPSYDQSAVSGIALPSRSDKLFSSSSDGTVHVWDCNTGQSIRVINLGVKIRTLISEGPWIFVGLPNIVKASLHLTCSASSSLAWDLDTLQCVHTLSGHNDAVKSLICWDQCLLSCSLDKTIKARAFTEEGSLDVIYTHNEEHNYVDLILHFVMEVCWQPSGTVQDFKFEDIHNNHAGIDSDSLKSNAYAPAEYYSHDSLRQVLNLKDRYAIQVFIDYDDVQNLLNVNILPNSKISRLPIIENGFEGAKSEEHAKESVEEPVVEDEKAESAALRPSEGVPETTGKEEPAADGHDAVNTQRASVEDLNTDDAEKKENRRT
ncbi:hypothetical protein GH714_012829 [Hevea brasiliensis]|uniref:C3H1-type domain-containing protein n=1 Tax=Hevea brasiliensis TaxID=3981 RepID=A0A6A6KQC1_HEVBR|nr:hypothetical protein GH714_012829 [Hevea brasiliensis]